MFLKIQIVAAVAIVLLAFCAQYGDCASEVESSHPLLFNQQAADQEPESFLLTEAELGGASARAKRQSIPQTRSCICRGGRMECIA